MMLYTVDKEKTKMNELGDLLLRLRNEKSLTLREAAEKTGLSHTYISDIEKGFRRGKGTKTPLKPSPDTLKRLSKAYDYPYEELMRIAGYLPRGKELISEYIKKISDYNQVSEETTEYKLSNVKDFDPDKWVSLPILGSIAAGIPIDRIEHVEGYQMVPRSVVQSEEAFVLRVKGDSMSGDGIRDGHLVVCVKQQEVQPHEIAVVAVGNEEATLKRVKFEAGICILMPSNPDMQPIIESADNVHVIGKAVMYTGYL